MLDQKKTGERIAELRKSKNLTQTALAEMLHVSHQAVSKWENGVALPDIEVLLRMREVFGISIDELLDSNPKAETPTPECEPATDPEELMELTVGPDESRVFASRVDVGSCTIKGKARFKARFHADHIQVTGRAEFDERVECDVLTQRGEFIAHQRLDTERLSNSGSMTVERQFHSDIFENTGALTFRDTANADSAHNCGAFTVFGDLAVDRVRNTGAFTCHKNLTADSLDNSGAFTCHGNTTADTMENSGALTCIQGLSVADAQNHGSLKVEGDLSAATLRSDGNLTVNGNVNIASGELSGRFRIGKKLNGAGIRVTLSDADCSAGEVVAASLTVERHPGSKPTVMLTARTIQVYQADLSFVVCDSVKARTARIGEGCRIKRLECEEEPEISPDAEVGEVVRG